MEDIQPWLSRGYKVYKGIAKAVLGKEGEHEDDHRVDVCQLAKTQRDAELMDLFKEGNLDPDLFSCSTKRMQREQKFFAHLQKNTEWTKIIDEITSHYLQHIEVMQGILCWMFFGNKNPLFENVIDGDGQISYLNQTIDQVRAKTFSNDFDTVFLRPILTHMYLCHDWNLIQQNSSLFRVLHMHLDNLSVVSNAVLSELSKAMKLGSIVDEECVYAIANKHPSESIWIDKFNYALKSFNEAAKLKYDEYSQAMMVVYKNNIIHASKSETLLNSEPFFSYNIGFLKSISDTAKDTIKKCDALFEEYAKQHTELVIADKQENEVEEVLDEDKERASHRSSNLSITSCSENDGSGNVVSDQGHNRYGNNEDAKQQPQSDGELSNRQYTERLINLNEQSNDAGKNLTMGV